MRILAMLGLAIVFSAGIFCGHFYFPKTDLNISKADEIAFPVPKITHLIPLTKKFADSSLDLSKQPTQKLLSACSAKYEAIDAITNQYFYRLNGFSGDVETTDIKKKIAQKKLIEIYQEAHRWRAVLKLQNEGNELTEKYLIFSPQPRGEAEMSYIDVHINPNAACEKNCFSEIRMPMLHDLAEGPSGDYFFILSGDEFKNLSIALPLPNAGKSVLVQRNSDMQWVEAGNIEWISIDEKIAESSDEENRD